MSVDVLLDENGNFDLTDGHQYVNGVAELKQSLEMRILSQVGWAVNDIEFGVEWLGFFGDTQNASLAADKIAEALEQDPRIQAVLNVTVTPDYQERIAHIQTELQLNDANLIADNGNPNLDFETNFNM